MGHLRNPQEFIGSESKEPWTWREIAEWIRVSEGKSISTSRCQQVAERALQRLRIALEDDPLIKEWLVENGYERPE